MEHDAHGGLTLTFLGGRRLPWPTPAGFLLRGCRWLERVVQAGVEGLRAHFEQNTKPLCRIPTAEGEGWHGLIRTP